MNKYIRSIIDKINDNVEMVLTTKDKDVYLLHVSVHTDKEFSKELETLKAQWNYSLITGELNKAKLKSERYNSGEYYVLSEPYLKELYIREKHAVIVFATHHIGREYVCEDCDEEEVEITLVLDDKL